MPALIGTVAQMGLQATIDNGRDKYTGPQIGPNNFVTEGQANAGYGNAQQGLQQQQDFINALQGQGGLVNQSQVFNQLGGIAGGGPNAAMAQLAQGSQANQAQQSALIAGQRNAGANTGAGVRQAAMSGANIQQQAAGQGNALQAQMAINALGMQGGIAGQQVQNLSGANQAFSQNANAAYANMLASQTAAEGAAVSQANNADKIGFEQNQADTKRDAALIGGIGQGVASIGSPKAPQAKAHGGMIKPQSMAEGGVVKPAAPSVTPEQMAQIDAALAAMAAQGGPLTGTMLPQMRERLIAQAEAETKQNQLKLKATESYDRSQQAFQQQQQVIQGLQAQGGIANQSQVFNAMGNVAQGQGFNPAQAQLANTSGTNVAQQAANAGTQRTTSANSALLGRQASVAGGNAQQQAANAAATMQAQQTLGALGAQGNIAGQQVGNLTDASQAYLQGSNRLYGDILTGGNARMANDTSRINAQANIAAAQQQASAQQQAAMIGAAGQGLATAFGSSGGAQPAPVAPAPTTSGIGTSTGSMPSQFAQGGEVKGPRSGFGQHLHGVTMKAGGYVPGKAAVAGDSKQNDTVPAMLSPGEVVIPRSVMQSQDPAKGAAAFVAAVLAKNGKALPRK